MYFVYRTTYQPHGNCKCPDWCLIDFCRENDLEPDPVIQIITAKIGRKRSSQIRKQGYISKI